jgi:hypothetical protein
MHRSGRLTHQDNFSVNASIHIHHDWSSTMADQGYAKNNEILPVIRYEGCLVRQMSCGLEPCATTTTSWWPWGRGSSTARHCAMSKVVMAPKGVSLAPLGLHA